MTESLMHRYHTQARALLRCRRLGSTLVDYVRLTLASHGAATAPTNYTSAAPTEYAGRGLNARV